MDITIVFTEIMMFALLSAIWLRLTWVSDIMRNMVVILRSVRFFSFLTADSGITVVAVFASALLFCLAIALASTFEIAFSSIPAGDSAIETRLGASFSLLFFFCCLNVPSLPEEFFFFFQRNPWNPNETDLRRI